MRTRGISSRWNMTSGSSSGWFGILPPPCSRPLSRSSVFRRCDSSEGSMPWSSSITSPWFYTSHPGWAQADLLIEYRPVVARKRSGAMKAKRTAVSGFFKFAYTFRSGFPSMERWRFEMRRKPYGPSRKHEERLVRTGGREGSGPGPGPCRRGGDASVRSDVAQAVFAPGGQTAPHLLPGDLSGARSLGCWSSMTGSPGRLGLPSCCQARRSG